jgi:CDP-diacylglycerol--glycerol-3-phosphate 3-phosphatidyltransferase
MNLPNRLTIIRLLFIPIIVFFALFPFAQFGFDFGTLSVRFVRLPIENLIIFILFALASFTDFLDGYIARRQRLITTFGKYIDPLADKLLINTLFILLALNGQIPTLVVLILIWRDAAVDGLRLMAARKGITMAAGFLGKVKTVSQMLTLGLYLLSNLPFELYQFPMNELMLWFTVIVSIMSGVTYFMQGKTYILESM